MGRTFIKLAMRKIKGHLTQFICTMFLVAIGIAFFVTLYTIYYRYNQQTEALFADYHYADVTYYGSFDVDDIAAISETGDVEAVALRKVQDIENDGIIYRIVTLTEEINEPYYYQGQAPVGLFECLIVNQAAQAMGYELGDVITLPGREYVISGIIASPEYVYLVQNERSLMADPETFAVIYVNADGETEAFNEIVVRGSIGKNTAFSIGERIGALRTIIKTDQINYNLYREDLDQIRTFAYVFPAVFMILIIMIIYVTIKRSVIMESKRIGFLKALGMGENRIIAVYSVEALAAGLLGSVLGLIFSMMVYDTIISLFAAMFEVPGLGFKAYPVLIAGAIIFAGIICLAVALFSLTGIHKVMPAELIRGRIPVVAGGKKTKENKAWSLLSFNTKYAIKSAIRNKGRFIALILGNIGSCALLVFALGFHNSITHTERQHFDEFVRYDAMIEIDAVPWETDHPLLVSFTESSRALALPVSVNGKEYKIIIVDDDFDMLDIDNDKLSVGVIIPEYYADIWNAEEGDKIKLNGVEAVISETVKQGFGLAMYASYRYAATVFPDLPQVYNIIFVRGIRDIARLSETYGFKYTTIDNDRVWLTALMENLEALILFMLVCEAALGITILYAIGQINLSAREYEYMFMGVLGYPEKQIVLACVKEAAMQLMIALPAGFVIGNVILNMVKGEFTSENFVIYPAIYWTSYLAAAVTVLVMSAVMIMISAWKINHLNIAEGIKVRDE